MKKTSLKILIIFLSLLLFLPFSAGTFALGEAAPSYQEGPPESPAPGQAEGENAEGESADGAVIEEPADDAPDYEGMFSGKSWDDLIADFMLDYKIEDRNLGLGYYNTVTGEEHYYNPDKYFNAGSLYKVPLNMVFAERVASGELDPEGNLGSLPYRYLLEETIINSNNDLPAYMWFQLGGYNSFRRTIAPYMGEDPDTVDPKYYENNFFTARQMVNCLRLLYEENERFPNIVETMLRAEPVNYFRRSEDRFDIAHKYGYDTVWGMLSMNDCAIVYTDEPIVIVAFTFCQYNAYDVLADYCTLMCDYTQYHSKRRAEAAALAEAASSHALLQLSSRNSAVALTARPSPVSTVTAPEREDGAYTMTTASLVALIVSFVLTVLIIAFIIRRNRGKHINFFWAVISILLVGAAVFMCVFAATFGPIMAKPKGDPALVPAEFFDALIAGHYDIACAKLDNYSDLGLSDEPESEEGVLVLKALKDSYAYVVAQSEDEETGLSSVQTVRFIYLDLDKLDAALQPLFESALAEELAPLSEDETEELYNEDLHYPPELIDRVYISALKTALASPEELYSATELKVELNYIDGRWLIHAPPELISALLGGITLT